MEVKINKEIRNYTESMFFGLSMRQFIFSVLACGVAVGLYFLLRPKFGTENLSLSMSRIAEMATSAVTNRVKGGQIKRDGKERTHGHK